MLNPETQKAAAHAQSKAKYNADPEAQKAAARAQSKAKYNADPETQKVAARVLYAKNPKIKIGHYKAYYAKNKKSICAKAKTNIRFVNQNLIR